MLRGPEDFDSLMELMNYFDTEAKCVAYFQQRRWGNTPICHHCGHDKAYRFSDGIRFKCAKCRKPFTVRQGTIFEDSKVPLRKWFIAIYLVTAHKKGISSHQLARDISVTQRTAWFMLQRIRHKLGVDNDPNEELEGVVEVDETFVGGKNKNRHYNKKVKNSQGRSFKDKTPVLGMMQRDGKVKTVVIPNTQGDIIQPILQQVVKEGSTVITDEWMAYKGLDKQYTHHVVNHGSGQYAIGKLIHTNTIEGFWAWLKRAYNGVYHYMSRKHLQQYAHEVTFRYNTRMMRGSERLNFALSLDSGALKYKQLIANH